MANWQTPPQPGYGNVGSYQISGIPFLTGSDVNGTGTNNGEVKISFPYVARSITVVNTGSVALWIHFDSRANTDVVTYKHYAVVANSGDAWAFNVRVKEIYVSAATAVAGGGFSLGAELTPIPVRDIPVMTGSGINSKGLGF